MATERKPYSGNPDDILDWVRITADGIVTTGSCLFWGVLVNGDAVGIGIVDVFDGTSTGGKLHGRFQASITRASVPFLLPKPVRFDQGIFADVSGAGFVEATVYFQVISPYHTPR